MEESINLFKKEFYSIKENNKLNIDFKILLMKNLLNRIKDKHIINKWVDNNSNIKLNLYKNQLEKLNELILKKYEIFKIINAKLNETKELKLLNLNEKNKAKELFENEIQKIIFKR